MRRIRSHVTPAFVISVIALFFAMSCTAVAAIVVSSNGQVASNTIAGHAPIAGIRPNLIAGSVNGTDLSAAARSAFIQHCPSGLLPSGDICVEATMRAETTWLNAIKICALAGRHLPDEGELALAFNALGASQPLQWTTDLFDPSGHTSALVLNQNESRALGSSSNTLGELNPYRCVVAPLN